MRADRARPASAALRAVVAFSLALGVGPGVALAEGRPLVIGGESVQPGERREILLTSSESFSSADVTIPIAVVRGERPGPVLCLIAGIHGDELNGVAIVREALEKQQVEGLRGTVIGVPIVNLFGFWSQSRYLPDRRDLNRHFPGRKTGSIASRIASRLWREVIVHCTHLIDFHTGSLHRANLPQVRADLRRPMTAELARAFGSEVLIHNPGARGTLRSAALEAGIPAILYEAGETLRFQRSEIDRGRAGIVRVMLTLKMVEGDPPGPAETDTFLETHWVRAPAGGLLELQVSLGDMVTVGQRLGVITDPLRRSRGSVTSAWAGQVVGLVLAPVVIPGLAVVHVGVPHGRMDRTEAGDELETDQPE